MQRDNNHVINIKMKYSKVIVGPKKKRMNEKPFFYGERKTAHGSERVYKITKNKLVQLERRHKRLEKVMFCKKKKKN